MTIQWKTTKKTTIMIDEDFHNDIETILKKG